MWRFALPLVFASFVSLPSGALALDCSRLAGDIPDASRRVGAEDLSNPIRHIVVIMQENHSFDQYFGHLNDPKFYGDQVDGVSPDFMNLDREGRAFHPYREASLCPKVPASNWNAAHEDWNEGANDSFVAVNDSAFYPHGEVMGNYAPEDLPYYYALANKFAVGDRYFSSVLSETFPNRFFLLTGTSFGHIRNDISLSYTQKTIFELLNDHRISWGYYTDSLGFLKLFGGFHFQNLGHMKRISDYVQETRDGTLPQVVFLDSTYKVNDEHPSGSIQSGQYWVSRRIGELMKSALWPSSVVFLAYDEAGGFFDHVAPPSACRPDGIAPMLDENSVPGEFDRYGFRVPFIAISPFVKHHFVSHSVYDHTSILKFIETKYNLPALTARDANADPFSDLFDYDHPDFSTAGLPSGDPDLSRSCGYMDYPDPNDS